MKQGLIYILFTLVVLGWPYKSMAQEILKATENQSPQIEARVFSTEDRTSPRALLKVSLVPKDNSSDVVAVVADATLAEGWHVYPTVIKKSEFGLATTIKIESEDHR